MPFFKIAVYVASLSPFTLNIALFTMDIEEAGTRLRPAPRPSRYVVNFQRFSTPYPEAA